MFAGTILDLLLIKLLALIVIAILFVIGTFFPTRRKLIGRILFCLSILSIINIIVNTIRFYIGLISLIGLIPIMLPIGLAWYFAKNVDPKIAKISKYIFFVILAIFVMFFVLNIVSGGLI